MTRRAQLLALFPIAEDSCPHFDARIASNFGRSLDTTASKLRPDFVERETAYDRGTPD
jgi:hypothetical protein